MNVRVEMEASGHARWFERLLSELRLELWIGDAAAISAKRVRKQKTDRQDAQLILKLMLKDDFPQIWVPNWENRDLRQLLWHRHRMVQARTRMMNQLQAIALNEGLRSKKRLWREAGREQLEAFQLAAWASQRRLDLLDRLNPTIAHALGCDGYGHIQGRKHNAGNRHSKRWQNHLQDFDAGSGVTFRVRRESRSTWGSAAHAPENWATAILPS
jgi:hypothetical protein